MAKGTCSLAIEYVSIGERLPGTGRIVLDLRKKLCAGGFQSVSGASREASKKGREKLGGLRLIRSTLSYPGVLYEVAGEGSGLKKVNFDGEAKAYPLDDLE